MPPQIPFTPTHYIPRTKATHPRLRIRSAHDAQIVFQAIRQGILSMVTQRLSVVDCDLLQPGQVYCWEHESGDSGIERWTDGRKWGASRARENFLFYLEQTMTENEGGSSSSTDNYRIPPEQRLPWDFRQDKRNSGFTKQTYSAWVTLSPGHARRWNLTAYFSGGDYLNLPTVDDDPVFSRLSVPSGIYTTVDSFLKKSERRLTSNSDPGQTSTRFTGHPIPQSPVSNPSEETLHAPRPRGPDFGDWDPDYHEPSETNNQVTSSSPLPRSPEDQRTLSLFKVQL